MRDGKRKRGTRRKAETGQRALKFVLKILTHHTHVSWCLDMVWFPAGFLSLYITIYFMLQILRESLYKEMNRYVKTWKPTNKNQLEEILFCFRCEKANERYQWSTKNAQSAPECMISCVLYPENIEHRLKLVTLESTKSPIILKINLTTCHLEFILS